MWGFKTCTTQKNYIVLIRSGTMRWIGHEARMKERRDAYRVLSQKWERKRSLGNSKPKFEENIENGPS